MLAALRTLSSIARAAIIRYDASIGTVPTEQGFAYTGSIASPIDTNGPTLQHGPTTALDVSAWTSSSPPAPSTSPTPHGRRA